MGNIQTNTLGTLTIWTGLEFIAPLIEHLSPINTSGFISVSILVADVISTAVRDAKPNIKHCITKHTRARNRRMKIWMQIQKPKGKAKFHKDRRLLFYTASSWHQSTEVHNPCFTAHSLGGLGGEMQLHHFLQSQNLRHAVRILIDAKKPPGLGRSKSMCLFFKNFFHCHNQGLLILLDQT